MFNRILILIFLSGLVYACASVSRSDELSAPEKPARAIPAQTEPVMAPAVESVAEPAAAPVMQDQDLPAYQIQQQKSDQDVQRRKLERKQKKKRIRKQQGIISPARTMEGRMFEEKEEQLLKTPKRPASLDEGGIGGTGNKDCQKDGCDNSP